ncbi:hypothetical protein [Bacillus sp. THAF10]|nr:hypothetical protein [Bacillus sp. THAF10]
MKRYIEFESSIVLFMGYFLFSFYDRLIHSTDEWIFFMLFF